MQPSAGLRQVLGEEHPGRADQQLHPPPAQPREDRGAAGHAHGDLARARGEGRGDAAALLAQDEPGCHGERRGEGQGGDQARSDGHERQDQALPVSTPPNAALAPTGSNTDTVPACGWRKREKSSSAGERRAGTDRSNSQFVRDSSWGEPIRLTTGSGSRGGHGALTARTLGMVSPKKDAVAVMDGLAVASMFDALGHTDRGGPEPGGPEPTGTPAGQSAGEASHRTKLGIRPWYPNAGRLPRRQRRPRGRARVDGDRRSRTSPRPCQTSYVVGCAMTWA